MNEKTSKSNHSPEQKSATFSKIERRETDIASADKPIGKAWSTDKLMPFQRKDQNDSESGNAMRYNFISKRYSAVRDATAIAITVSMGGMAVMLSSGMLFGSMKLAYSSLYFAGAGIASAMVLAANSLYFNHAKKE
ncbi:hypothetical protein M1567_01465 [Candidatus Marsarchaeota archaeon]|jgi:hypothetical protein|nr:hypothetical protein [Candidatus Marsarchaeota archaeon]